MANYSDSSGTSKNTFKISKTTIDASGATVPRTITIGDNAIDFATASIGQVLKKTGSNAIGFAAESGGSGYTLITGPSTMSGTYQGDVIVDCTLGTVDITGDITVKGNLLVFGDGTYHLGAQATLLSAQRTFSFYQDVYFANGTNFYANSASGVFGSALYVRGNLHAPESTIEINGGVGVDAGSIICFGDIHAAAIYMNGGTGDGTTAGQGGQITSYGNIFVNSIIMLGGDEPGDSWAGGGGSITSANFLGGQNGVSAIQLNGGNSSGSTGLVNGGAGGSIICKTLTAQVTANGGYGANQGGGGGNITASTITVPTSGSNYDLYLSGNTSVSGGGGGTITCDEIYNINDILLNGSAGGTITATTVIVKGSIQMNAQLVGAINGGGGGNATIKKLKCNSILLQGVDGANLGGDSGVLVCDDFEGQVFLRAGDGGVSPGILKNSKIKSSSNKSVVWLGYLDTFTENPDIYLGGYWNNFDAGNGGTYNSFSTNFKLYVLDNLHITYGIYSPINHNINVKTYLDSSNLFYRRCFFSCGQNINKFKVNGASGNVAGNSLYMSIGGASQNWYETIMTTVP